MSLKVLIVEDDIDLAEQIKDILYLKSFQADYVENGYQLIEKLKTDIPDIIILDIMLPGKNGHPPLNGFELCRRIKKAEKLKDINVIFMSGKIAKTDVKKCFEVGGSYFLLKPFMMADIVKIIKTFAKDINTKKLKSKNKF